MQRASTYDVAVVLGHALDRNGRPSRVLAERVDHAVELLKRGVVKHVLFRSGVCVRNGFAPGRRARREWPSWPTKRGGEYAAACIARPTGARD
eukprot:1182192-Prorocentrum_minimum.AAC.1